MTSDISQRRAPTILPRLGRRAIGASNILVAMGDLIDHSEARV